MIKSPVSIGGLLGLTLVGAGVGAGVGGCTSAPDQASGPSAQRSALHATPAQHLVIPWGEGPAQAGLHRAMSESLDQGPSSVAVAANGELLITDRLNQRVLRVGERGVVGSWAIAPDVELVTAGPAGSWLAYSPLRSHVWIGDGNGNAVAEMDVPRELRNVQVVTIGASRRVEVTNSFQETFQLGSPSFPLPLAVVLQSKEEGVLRVANNRRVQVVRENGVTQLQTLAARTEAGLRGVIVRATLEGDAALLIGETGGVACVRAETVSGTGAISVDRRAVCVDFNTGASMGKQVLSVDLPAPGLYVPRQEVAVGAGHLVSMVPQSDGLAIDVYTVPSVRGGGAQ